MQSVALLYARTKYSKAPFVGPAAVGTSPTEMKRVQESYTQMLERQPAAAEGKMGDLYTEMASAAPEPSPETRNYRSPATRAARLLGFSPQHLDQADAILAMRRSGASPSLLNRASAMGDAVRSTMGDPQLRSFIDERGRYATY